MTYNGIVVVECFIQFDENRFIVSGIESETDRHTHAHARIQKEILVLSFSPQ